MTAHAICLETTGDTDVALQSVHVESNLMGLFAHTQLTQRFVNTEDRSIEAVYTFPIPHNAVFLGLEVTIGDKVMQGVVMADAKADRGYEEAIQDGDAAVLLRQVEPGLYSVSVGNIVAGEAITLRYSFAQQLGWQGKTLRFSLPTTIAPRYGNPAAIGLQPHETIEHEIGVGYALSMSINVTGELASCAITSPSHEIACKTSQNGMSITLTGETTSMDRDFVLVLTGDDVLQTTAMAIPNPTTSGVTEAVHGSWVAGADFYLPIPKSSANRSGIFRLVIDCSGSMGGDSIQQARQAAMAIIDSLQDEDLFNVTVFGSHAESLFDEPMAFNGQTLMIARKFLSRIGADMGGTAIDKALAQACPTKAKKSQNSNVLLITDGQIFDGQRLIQQNQARGHRIFTLGVGSAVSDAFLQELASATGGACELVAPNEHMAEHIVRHFGRMRQLRVIHGEISWYTKPVWSVPSDLGSVFAGDTLHVGAGFAREPEGQVELNVTYEDGTKTSFSVTLETLAADSEAARALPRVLAQHRLSSLSDQRRIAVAIDYQLLTNGTKCLMTHKRADGEKADDLPVLRGVPHEMAAGWGGTSSVMAGASAAFDHFDRRPMACVKLSEQRLESSTSEIDSDAYADIPAFLRRTSDESDFEESPSKIAGAVNAIKGLFGEKAKDGKPLKDIGVSRELRWKLADHGIHTVEDLLTVKRADWKVALELTDEDIVELLRALRIAGHKVS